MVLEEEQKTYGDRKAELLRVARGEYVLIKGKKVVDTFETRGDAVRVGYRMFGNVPFFTKEIVEVDVPLTFTRGLSKAKLGV